MTKSTITRERVVALIAEHSYDSALVDALEHLLAAMDSEPVAVTDDELNAALQLHRLKVDGHSQLSDAFRAGFRYARRTAPQPAPVVPEEMTPQQASRSYGGEVRGYRAGWNACRAAMLQELKKSAGTEAICRSDENVQVLHTKSPAQSDCCPAQNSVTPAQGGVFPAQGQGWIPVSERMPESNKFVLVSNGVWVGQGLYDDSEHLESDEHWQDEHREFINVLHHPVTHWMPLSAAPQETNS